MNNTVNRSTGKTPSMLLFGVHQRGEMDDNLRLFFESQVETSRSLDEERAEAAAEIIKQQQYNKKKYDEKHKTPRRYNAGDYVVVKNVDTTPGINKKLIPKFKGPYQVKAVLDYDRYVIEDVPGFPVTQIPFREVYNPANMKPWYEDQDIPDSD